MGAFYFAMKDLRILFRDKSALVMLFITPIFIITIASFALSGLFNPSSNTITIPVAILDKGEMGQRFLEELEKIDDIIIEKEYEKNGHWVPLTEEQARTLVKKRKAAIIIPADFSQKIDHRLAASVLVLKDPSDRIMAQVVENISYRMVDKFNISMVSLSVASDTIMDVVDKAQRKQGIHLDPRPALYQAGKNIDELMDHPPITVVTENVLQRITRKVTPFESNVPGYAVMFVLLGVSSAAGALLTEKEEGTIKRLLSMPISKGTILGGKAIGSFLQAALQTTLLFTVGHFVFGMWLGSDIVALICLILITCYAATGLGMLLASICKTRAQVSGQGLLLILSMSALGGSWWPLYITPEWMQKIAHITVTAWAMDGFNGLLIYGYTFSGILDSLLVLSVMGTVFLAIAFKRFQLE